MRKKSVFWMNLMLAVMLAVNLFLPIMRVDAAVKADKKKVLVVYFSATGTTKGAANKIKKASGGKLYQIKPVDPYTAEDLNYDNDDCRANTEQQDKDARPQIRGNVKNISKYDVIFLGYPIWWGKEPMIIRTFLESNSLKGKTIVPFCTSGGSGISGSMEGIRVAAGDAKVVKGKDLTDASYKYVQKWVKKKMK